MIDTHCHLTFPDFRHRVPQVLERAAAHGVSGCISVSTTTHDCLEALALARAYPNVWCTAGVHPLHAHENPHLWEHVRLVAADPRCVAWGEIGLDNHYPTPERRLQLAILEAQLACIREARAIDKPVVLHCRDAFDDLIPVLRDSAIDPARCVFHCFTGDASDMRKVLDFGAHASFTGIVTYRNASAVRDAARLVPADRLMVETDAPFLSPEPHRSTRPCEPWMVSATCRALAELREQPFDDFHEQINANTSRFFGISWPTAPH